MRHLVIGLLAHVDAGKTTLAEALLYQTGAIRVVGRVDHGDAHLDYDPIERDRGITVFAKQAQLDCGNEQIVLLDTPGHVDFSAEAERTLQVLDLAVLVVGANDGVTGHTKTLWRLLARYEVPTIVFVNKMDLAGANADAIMAELTQRLGGVFFDCAHVEDPAIQEQLALASENALEELLEEGRVLDTTLCDLVTSRMAFPCVFGSALREEGISELLMALLFYTPQRTWPDQFGARVYKVTHGTRGERLVWMRVTGGVLEAKSQISGTSDGGEAWTNKVDQLQVCTDVRTTTARAAEAGQICAVLGLSHVCAGDGLGAEDHGRPPALQPVLDYRVIPCGCDVNAVHSALDRLQDEDPLLRVAWSEELQELRLQLMGAIQQEVVQRVLQERYGLDVEFGPGSVLYQETIDEPVLGIGHFEPLRHYAEVHLRLEPGSRGSGVVACSECSEDELARNWQRLILTHVNERTHRGVLTGAPLTDVRVVLVAGRAHAKHTEGGDFRQATYRAIRQALMQAKSTLLEPWYDFQLEVSAQKVGRALADLQRMSARFGAPLTDGETALLEGSAPVSTMRDYALQVSSYTAGTGSLSLEFGGYEPCHNASVVQEEAAYDPEADLEHTPDSVFCVHGAGYTVKWYDVAAHAHVSG